MEPPRYYDYYNNAYKIIETSAGRLRGYLLDVNTGRFEVANSKLSEIRYAGPHDITHVSEKQFIEIAEENRSRYLRGDGPIFALYELIDSYVESFNPSGAEAQARKVAVLSLVRRMTFDMWEEEFARQDSGEPPSFRYEVLGGQAVIDKYSAVDPTPDQPR
jgi:hypothetical protein